MLWYRVESPTARFAIKATSRGFRSKATTPESFALPHDVTDASLDVHPAAGQGPEIWNWPGLAVAETKLTRISCSSEGR